MKTSSEMNYVSVNPLINITDLSYLLYQTDGGWRCFQALRSKKDGKVKADYQAAAAIHCSHGLHLVQHLFFMYFIIKTCEFCKASLLHADQS